MHLASFIILSLSFYYAQADSNTSMSGPQLKPMKCTNIYLTLSERDIAEMQSKGGLNPSQRAKLSTNPVEAVCKSSAAGDNGGLCDFKTCSGKPAGT
ncbi:hypothetical protein PGTUg99_011583 [Puccinia graminis f. sp. tritici]|uniref:Uncharacterized protein n=1 Tax=Puccinia graminis f. sp. tritici TaxID=56615 RepID=A0A5B0RE66_PUCGR|nr:hypothetical protein PGTUg99_011583 [Puccinia graminis f. sp. tritici]